MEIYDKATFYLLLWSENSLQQMALCSVISTVSFGAVYIYNYTMLSDFYS